MNIFTQKRGGSTIFEMIIAITLITFILFFPVITFSLTHKQNLLADTLALGLQAVSIEGGLTNRVQTMMLDNLSAKGLIPENPAHPIYQRVRFESNADARNLQVQNLRFRDGADPKISFEIWYPADAEISLINGLSRLIGANNQNVPFRVNEAGEVRWYYRMRGYIFSEKINF